MANQNLSVCWCGEDGGEEEEEFVKFDKEEDDEFESEENKSQSWAMYTFPIQTNIVENAFKNEKVSIPETQPIKKQIDGVNVIIPAVTSADVNWSP